MHPPEVEITQLENIVWMPAWGGRGVYGGGGGGGDYFFFFFFFFFLIGHTRNPLALCNATVDAQLIFAYNEWSPRRCSAKLTTATYHVGEKTDSNWCRCLRSLIFC